MRLHYFKIDENARRTGRGTIHHLRQFWTIHRGNSDRQLFAGHIETILRKPRLEFSARFHVGTAGSETPFDGHLTIFGSGIYWGTENGRKLASRITREKKHQYEGRDLSINLYGEGSRRLYWRIWTHQDRTERGEFAKWRDSSVNLNLLDHWFGQKKYTYTDLEWALIAIVMPEGTYPVRATLQEVSFGRPKTKRPVKSLTISVDAPKGIPTHYDKSGGWKGDRTYGFSVGFKERREDWAIDAGNAITAWVYDHRARSGFREAQAEETS